MTPHALRGALGSAALAAAYAVAMAAGRATRLDGSETALVWPAAAVAVVWLLIARNGLLQLVACGLIVLETILINRLTGASLPLGAGFALVNLVCAWLVARALCWRRREPRLVQPSDLGWLLGAILVGNTVSAVIGGWVLMAHGAPWVESVISFGTRNGVSVFVGVAAYLSVLEVARSHTVGGRRAEGGLLHGLEVAAVYGAGVIVYGGVFFLNTGNPFAYLAIPISVFVGLRLSALAGIVHTVLFGTVVIVATFTGHGVFVNGDVGIRAVLAQALVGCCLLVTLTIALYRDSRAALVADLDAAHQETRTAAEELRRLALYDTLTGLANRSLAHRAPRPRPGGLAPHGTRPWACCSSTSTASSRSTTAGTRGGRRRAGRGRAPHCWPSPARATRSRASVATSSSSCVPTCAVPTSSGRSPGATPRR